MKKIFLIISILFSTTIFAQRYNAKIEQLIRPELTPILQTALDLAELQPYFHLKKNVTDKQIVFEEEAPFTAENLKGLTKFNKPVSVLKHSEIVKLKIKKYLSLHDWEIAMDNCKLELNFKGEGILISYQLKKVDTKWIILSYKITEKK